MNQCKQKQTDFNKILDKQILNAVESEAIRSELILESMGYELKITLTKIEEDE